MKVFAFVKIPKHPQPDGPGGQKGDLVFFWPIVPKDKLGKKTLNVFLPVVVDITIPCSAKFGINPPCRKCKDNDPAVCDYIKYQRPLWSTGSILDPPTMLKKFRYSIDRDKFIDGASEAVVIKTEKTEAEKETIVASALNNEQSVAVIKDNM